MFPVYTPLVALSPTFRSTNHDSGWYPCDVSLCYRSFVTVRQLIDNDQALNEPLYTDTRVEIFCRVNPAIRTQVYVKYPCKKKYSRRPSYQHAFGCFFQFVGDTITPSISVPPGTKRVPSKFTSLWSGNYLMRCPLWHEAFDGFTIAVPFGFGGLYRSVKSLTCTSYCLCCGQRH